MAKIPMDVYVYAPLSMGGVNRFYNAADIVRICAPVYLRIDPAPELLGTARTANVTIRKGSKDKDAVKALQTRLNAAAKAGLAVDGIFGVKTEAAVKAYQKANGLAIDGIVGRKTWAKLL